MNQDRLNTLFHSTSDEQYKKFLCDRGWEFETETAAKAAYERMKKVSAGAVLTEEIGRASCRERVLSHV